MASVMPTFFYRRLLTSINIWCPPRALSTNQGDRARNAWYKLRSYNQPGPLSTGQSTSQASARPPHKAALLNATQGLPKTGRLREPCRS